MFASLIEIMLQKILESEKEKCKDNGLDIGFDFIITESFSWHEITLTLFCNDYKFMSDILVGIRELSLADVTALLCPTFEKAVKLQVQKNKESLDTLIILEDIVKKVSVGSTEGEMLFQLREIWKNNLIAHHIKQDATDGKSVKDIGQTHVFVKTVTSFGYDPAVLKAISNGKIDLSKLTNFYQPKLSKANIKLLSRWHVKPGHAGYVFDFNRNTSVNGKKVRINEIDEYFFVIGDSDYTFSNIYSDLERTWIFANQYQNSNGTISYEDNIAFHSRRVNTLPRIRYNNLVELEEATKRYKIKEAVRSDKHFYFNRKLINKNISFSLEEQDNIRDWLYQCKVSKLLLEKVLHMFVNFNDGVQDPLLFIYFIELKRYLNEVKEYIEKQANPSQYENDPTFKEEGLESLHNSIDQFVSMFDKAYNNRFHQSYLTATVTDYNVEYNGGCQQILSALDALYKTTMLVFGDEIPYTSFAYVTGLTETKSNYYSLRLNYFHIFQPSMLLSLITKEAANFFEGVNAYPSSDIKSKDTMIGNKFNHNLSTIKAEDHKDIFVDIYKLCKEETNNDLKRIIKKYISIFTFGDYKENSDSILENLGQKIKQQETCYFLDYLKSDTLNYFYTYNLDSKLFIFWYWSTWAEMSFQQEKNGINEGSFVNFMLRIVFITRHFDSEFFKYNEVPLPLQYKDSWEKHFNDIILFIDFLLEKCKPLNTFLHRITLNAVASMTQDVKRISEKILNKKIKANEIELNKEERDKVIDDIIKYNNREYFSETPRKLSSKVRNIMNQCEALIGKQQDVLADHECCLEIKLIYTENAYKTIRNRLISGELNTYWHFNHEKPSNTESLLDVKNDMVFYAYSNVYSYLKYLFEMNCNEEGKLIYNPVLFRNDNSGHVEMFKEVQNAEDLMFYFEGLLFDPMGGILTVNKSLKRKHLRARSTLLRSFWDMSLKMKMEMLTDSEIT